MPAISSVVATRGLLLGLPLAMACEIITGIFFKILALVDAELREGRHLQFAGEAHQPLDQLVIGGLIAVGSVGEADGARAGGVAVGHGGMEKAVTSASSTAFDIPCGILKKEPSGRLMPWTRATEALENAMPAWVAPSIGFYGLWHRGKRRPE